jgi:hypothetical protein
MEFDIAASGEGIRSFDGIYAVIEVKRKADDRIENDPIEQEFNQQKEAFLKRMVEEPLYLTPYRGKFIAARDGHIVESDDGLAIVTDRFFSRFGDVPVYIGRIDGKRKVSIDSPNRIR